MTDHILNHRAFMHGETTKSAISRAHRQFYLCRDSGLEPDPKTGFWLDEWKGAVRALRVAQHYGSRA